MIRVNPDTSATPALPHRAQLLLYTSWTNLRGRISLRNLCCVSGLLAAGLIVILLVSLHIKSNAEKVAQREFDFICNEIRLNIADRLASNAQVLRSGAAFFNATGMVSREEWRDFTQRLQIEQYLPGTQGIGFARLIPREQLAQHIEEMRRQGFPDYQVRPADEREIYSSIIYIEPFSDRNLRAFGYDMFSEPVRRVAMERARDEDTAALSGKVTLVQETGEDLQSGALMYVPVYRRGLPTETLEQRRAALQGWVYSPYRMTDLMRGTLRGWDVKQKDRHIYLQIYDGDELSPETLLYDSQNTEDATQTSTDQVTRLIPVVSAGHRWTLRFIQHGGLAPIAGYKSAWFVLFGGTIINLLLFWLLLSLLSTRAHARRAERLAAELGQSEERYRQLFESASDALFLVSTDTGQIVEANSMALELYGYDRDELLTRTSMDLSAEPEETLRFTYEMQTFPDRILNIPQRLHLKKDGTVFPVEITARRFAWKGHPVLFIAVRDITERKRAEEQIRQLQKAESLSRMAGASAHHFNNQLSVVMGNLEIALQDHPRDGNTVRRLHNAMAAAQKAAEVSGLMLAYLGQTVGKREPLDLSEVCSRSLPMLRVALPKDVVLETDLCLPGPIIQANANQIQQVLTNLFTNAWEAIGDGWGIVYLKVKEVGAADISASNRHPVSWQPEAPLYACLEVADTGSGIPAGDIEKLFDPFFSSKFTGRGLGLSVALGLVKVHGGAITVETEPGRGCIFRAFFPLSEEIVSRQTNQATPAPEMGMGGTALLVEDEEAVRETVAILLERLGFTVLTAKDGVEAVEVFQKCPDDVRVVLCDLTMPRMNGWETLEALRKLAPGIPVVLASGYDQTQVLEGDHPERPQAFLHKPYQMAELKDALARAMGRERIS
jgi:PAS domain S-box-containing protein